MNVRKLYILTWALLMLITCFSQAQTAPKKANLFLFTDRDYCVSGDTLWFKVELKNGWGEKGNVVHVQLDAPNNQLITSVIKKSKDNWAEGYLFVPDSLSTGVYFLSAFMNAQRSNPGLEMHSRTLFVYNRFDENVTAMTVPSGSLKERPKKADEVSLKINKTEFAPREKVTVTVDGSQLAGSGVKKMVVRATKTDELAADAGGIFNVKAVSNDPDIPFLNENDGFIISGKVTDSESGTPQNGIMVLLSIVGEPPYFDYSVSQKDGGFYFFLKNAEGNANVVLQTVAGNQKEYTLQLEKNYLVRSTSVTMDEQILKSDETDFISTALRGSFIRRLFKGNVVAVPDSLHMPPLFSIPFYGKPENHIVPAEFTDLPNFQEVSRELLPGVQYRERDGEVTLRIVNKRLGGFFDSEPLRLINGIPVFKNALFSPLKSTDIHYIDIVQDQRLFGDLIFDGVLAVLLNDKSNMWLAQQPNIFQFSVNCLQRDRTPAYNRQPELPAHSPDIRQVYLWKTMETTGPETFEFFLSDVKGTVEISLEGVNDDGENIKISKTIEVK